MLVFYSGAQGKADVPAESPKDETLENVLTILRSLDQRRGFMGILLRKPHVLQLMPSRSRIRIELLDSSQLTIESCEVDRVFAEQLIEAASKDLDVFKLARQVVAEWERTNLR